MIFLQLNSKKMGWVLEIEEKSSLSPLQHPSSLFQPSPPLLSSSHSGSNISLNNKVSPSVLLIFIILAIIFFISGLLHLLVRFLIKPTNRDSDDELENGSALQGQLQQLFHLHDAGVDQSFIDTLPIFNYKAIIGVKDPFDCAVCLCEFVAEDELRLLPKCSHAFHMECIDTWLLSHSTCPLCRAILLPDFSPNGDCSPTVLVLESGSESSREIVQEGGLGSTNSVARVNSHLSHLYGDDCRVLQAEKSGEIQEKEDGNKKLFVGSGENVVPVKLGKFRNVGVDIEGSTNNNNVDERRCLSMGSFAYVMDGNTSLQVPIRTPSTKKQSSKKSSLPLTPGHRLAMSECGCDSRREFNGFEAFRNLENSDGNDRKVIGKSKRDSFSVSKIWLRGKKYKPNSATAEASRRAFSFRFPVHWNAVDEAKAGGGSGGARRAVSEIDISRWENGGSELGCDEEIRSCNSLDSQANQPSFAKRTLLWLMGTQNKLVQSSFSYNV
ncbi:RING-H2 finger protein ATL13-like isoform X1 [Olea europaea var. sylvestris]|uniref:RING-H2 finger protein ATL13-like isoform X1 n=1 Tax=Olea europaea var. sylvestris TaxID=158386 RepID=UPI000C1D43FD|nr:RING-H2 finger protein ATL13-like isoform X1 [Olea europaea var. sylvestris]